jgi:hypothetical protein
MPGARTMAMVLLAFALAPGPGASADEPRTTAREGFARLVASTTPDGDPGHPEAWPEALVGKRDGYRGRIDLERWRREGAARLAAAKVLAVREDGDFALVRVATAKGEAEVPLRRSGASWVLDAPVEWLVKGKDLDAANGRRPATVRLTARTTNGAYGTSAFSFAHVTQDPEACLNRMDLWYCHNGDLHASGRSAVTEAESGSLARAREIPVAAAWERVIRPRKDGVYLLRARRDGHRDFWVRFRVTGLSPAELTLEWNLLSLGEGAPASIAKEQPWKQADPSPGRPGADGYDGLCGRHG